MNSYYIAKTSTTSWALFTESASGFCHDSGESVANTLAEVRNVFIDIFGGSLVEAHPLLTVIQNQDGPMTIREHHLIFLSSRGLYHQQHIYQFAHELCHFMVPCKVCEAYRWFEETLCEAMSWYVLLQIAERGKRTPIPELIRLYSSMNSYVINSQSKRISLENKHVSNFIAEKLFYLHDNCYDRATNAAIAYAIFPIFQEYPGLWKIVPYLHTLSDDMTLPDALNHLSFVAGVVDAGGNKLKKRLTE